MGGAFSPDGRLLYYGSANEGRIIVLDVATLTVTGTIDLNTDGFEDSFAGDLRVSRDGRRLFVVDRFNYRFVAIDVSSRKVIQSVRVGRNPFAIALARDEKSAWVSNVGMFEYPRIPSITELTRESADLPFPAYGVPPKEAETGADVNGVHVPGLGSPNHPDAISVFNVDLATGRVVHRIKTGYCAIMPDPRLFDPDTALKPFDRRFNRQGLAAWQAMDDSDDMRRQLPKQR